MNYDIKNPDLKADPLILDLTQPTEVKAAAAGPAPDDFLFKPAPAPPGGDFEPPPAPGPPPGISRTTAPGFDDPGPNDDTPRSPADFEEQAKLYIAFADGVQSLALPYFYQKQNFTPDELSRLAEIGQAPDQVKPEDEPIKAKGAAFTEYMEALPFKTKEEKLLLGPLAKVLEKYNHAPGPETALIMAALTVMAPRVLPLLKFGN